MKWAGQLHGRGLSHSAPVRFHNAPLPCNRVKRVLKGTCGRALYETNEHEYDDCRRRNAASLPLSAFVRPQFPRGLFRTRLRFRDQWILVTVPANVVTLDAGSLNVKLVPLTEIGACSASDRLAEVIHGVINFVENPLSDKVSDTDVLPEFTATMANDRFSGSLKAVIWGPPK